MYPKSCDPRRNLPTRMTILRESGVRSANECGQPRHHCIGGLFTLGEKEDGKIIHGANSTADHADETDGSSREDRFALTQRTLQQIGANETRADKR